MLDSNGYCCNGDNPRLDRSGACCPGGNLDVCGVCGGDGVVVDARGGCCNGVLDASGMCCPRGVELDVCGVCGGEGDCGLVVNATVLLTQHIPIAVRNPPPDELFVLLGSLLSLLLLVFVVLVVDNKSHVFDSPLWVCGR